MCKQILKLFLNKYWTWFSPRQSRQTYAISLSVSKKTPKDHDKTFGKMYTGDWFHLVSSKSLVAVTVDAFIDVVVLWCHVYLAGPLLKVKKTKTPWTSWDTWNNQEGDWRVFFNGKRSRERRKRNWQQNIEEDTLMNMKDCRDVFLDIRQWKDIVSNLRKEKKPRWWWGGEGTEGWRRGGGRWLWSVVAGCTGDNIVVINEKDWSLNLPH